MATDPAKGPTNLTLLDQTRTNMPILTTKVTIPPARSDTISRPRLIEMLRQGWQSRLTLVSAPPGSGKTSAVIEWCHSDPELTNRIAWLSLDASDNDPARFLSYLIAALRTVEPEIGETVLRTIGSGQPADPDAMLTALINDLEALSDHAVLVLDDYHVVTSADIHEFVIFLITHLPSHVRLVLTSRIDPPLPLPRLRSRREVTDITEEDLRFTPEETSGFLTEVMGIQLEGDQIERIQERTEGWIAGLVLAALSVQASDGNSAVIDEIAGDHHFIFDYLAQEVLLQQDQQTRDFLLRTSIVERLSGRLCDALLDQSSSREMLADLAQRNLFTIPLDQRRGWYRYHHLFAEFLREELRQGDPEAWQALHQRASNWYENAGYVEEAVNHALQSGDIDHTVSLLEAHGFDTFWSGRAATVQHWLDALPEEVVIATPVLRVLGACSIIVGLRQEDARRWRELLSDDFVDQLDDSLKGFALVLQAVFERVLNADLRRTVELSRRALDVADESDLPTRTVALYHLGSASRMQGELRQAVATLNEVLELSERSQNSGLRLAAESQLAMAHLELGELQRAHDIAREAIAFEAENYIWDRGFVPGSRRCLAEVLFEWNELEESIHYVHGFFEAIEEIGDAEDLRMTPAGSIALARTKRAAGDPEGARDALNEAFSRADQLDLPGWRLRQIRAARAELDLRSGRIDDALAWAETVPLSDLTDVSYESIDEALVLARVLHHRGEFASARRFLQRISKIADAERNVGYTVRLHLTNALISQSEGDEDAALRSFRQALHHGEPDGYLRTFINEGEPVARLLKAVLREDSSAASDDAGFSRSYAERILEALNSLSASTTQEIAPAVQQGLIEPLSEREIEVIRLIADGKTNAEIADELFLAVGTVKRHTHNIYGKLGARHRTEAVALAQGAGVLN